MELGYEFDVVGREVREYECPLCMMLLREAQLLPCSHSACKICLGRWEQEQINIGNDFKCPFCQTPYQRDEIHDGKILDRIITTSLEVRCLQYDNECDWKGTISEYHLHDNQCEFKTVKCCFDGCEEKAMRRVINSHEKKCDFRIIPCHHCGEGIAFNTMSVHQRSCGFVPVECENKQCEKIVLRSKLMEHVQNECLYADIPCQFADVGCTVVIQRASMMEHLKETSHHLHLSVLQTMKLANTFNEFKEMSVMKIQSLENLNKSAYQKIMELTEKVTELEETMRADEIRHREVVNDLGRQVQDLNVSLQQLELKHNKELERLIDDVEEHFSEVKESINQDLLQPRTARGGKKDSVSTIASRLLRTHSNVSNDLTSEYSFKDLKSLLENNELDRFIEIIQTRPQLATQRGSPYRTSLLHIACKHNRVRVIDILLANECHLRMGDRFGEQPLHEAVREGHMEATQKLLGLDNTIINEENKDHWTALHIAASNNVKPIVEFLLQQPRIDVNKKTKKGKTADNLRLVSDEIKALIKNHREAHM